MHRLRAILHELVGLVVDDAILAVAAVVWVGVIWGLVSRAGLPGGWAGIVLFAGLAMILVESATRRARH